MGYLIFLSKHWHPTFFTGVPNNPGERAEMLFTLFYKSQITTCTDESLFIFFLHSPSFVLLPPSFVTVSSVPFVVLLLSSWPWQCCVVAASSFFPFEVSYPSSFVVVVCLWLLLLVFLMDGKFIGVHCVCLLLQCIFSWCSAKMNRQSVWVFSKNIFLLLK